MKHLLPLLHLDKNTKSPLIIAGPCSAESESQIITTATALHDCGINIFRAGIWKPRTKPGGFEGVGAIGLEWLIKAKEVTGMLMATEVANKTHVQLALDANIDLLWIGARTSANPFAMQEIADAIKDININIPILVKNPVNPDLELWIGALERLYNAGIKHIGAIHRGFSAYGTHIYRNMPQWHIPIELRRRYPNIPIIGDPSHLSGKRDHIYNLSQQMLDMGYSGLIIESHCNPDCALSDKNQQVTPAQLKKIISSLSWRNKNQPSENLTSLRRQIDELDSELIEILKRRMSISREIGEYKKLHNMPVVQIERHDEIMRNRVKSASEAGINPDFMRIILSAIHSESVRQQIEINSAENDGNIIQE